MTEAKKKPALSFTKGGMTYEMAEVGAFSWEEREDGSISMHASPPGVAPVTASPMARGTRSMSTRQTGPTADNVSGLLRKGAEAFIASPRLQEKADELRGKAKESAQRAREQAAADEAAANPVRGRDPEAEAAQSGE